MEFKTAIEAIEYADKKHESAIKTGMTRDHEDWVSWTLEFMPYMDKKLGRKYIAQTGNVAVWWEARLYWQQISQSLKYYNTLHVHSDTAEKIDNFVSTHKSMPLKTMARLMDIDIGLVYRHRYDWHMTNMETLKKEIMESENQKH